MTILFLSDENCREVELIENQNIPQGETVNTSVSLGIQVKNYQELLDQGRELGILIKEPTILGGNMECFFVADPNGVGIQIIKA